jgi:hypothetical protein
MRAASLCGSMEWYPKGVDVLSVGPFDSTRCVDHLLGQFVNVGGGIERQSKSQKHKFGEPDHVR